MKKAVEDFLKVMDDDYKNGVETAMNRVEDILSKYKDVQTLFWMNETVKRFRL